MLGVEGPGASKDHSVVSCLQKRGVGHARHGPTDPQTGRYNFIDNSKVLKSEKQSPRNPQHVGWILLVFWGLETHANHVLMALCMSVAILEPEVVEAAHLGAKRMRRAWGCSGVIRAGGSHGKGRKLTETDDACTARHVMGKQHSKQALRHSSACQSGAGPSTWRVARPAPLQLPPACSSSAAR